MKEAVFVTGNDNKADYFARLAGVAVEHHAVEGHEIQSLDLREVVTEKARVAYDQLQRPVVVEDTSLVLRALGKLPGTFIKWFIDEPNGLENVCRMVDGFDDRSAIASSCFAYFDGQDFTYFDGSLEGSIADHPRADAGFGWNPLFMPIGYNETLGEMDQVTFEGVYLQIKAIRQVGEFLRSVDK